MQTNNGSDGRPAAVAQLNAQLAGLDGADEGHDVEKMFERSEQRIETRKRLAEAVDAESGAVVLAQTRNDGRKMGALVSPSPSESGQWRVSFFDDKGFSGDTERASKREAVLLALEEGYRDTDRGLLTTLAATQEFKDGNAWLPAEARARLKAIVDRYATDNLYNRLFAAGCQMDSHESDLYVKATPTALAVVEQFEKEGHPTNRSFFTSQVDNERWVELPFSFAPYWEARADRREGDKPARPEGSAAPGPR